MTSDRISWVTALTFGRSIQVSVYCILMSLHRSILTVTRWKLIHLAIIIDYRKLLMPLRVALNPFLQITFLSPFNQIDPRVPDVTLGSIWLDDDIYMLQLRWCLLSILFCVYFDAKKMWFEKLHIFGLVRDCNRDRVKGSMLDVSFNALSS